MSILKIKALEAQVERKEARIKELERINEAQAEGLKSFRGLIDESFGVVGLHMNGSIVFWDDLETDGKHEEWLSAFNAAEKLAA